MSAYIVQLERGVWLAQWAGDPGRTLVMSNAKRWPASSGALAALAEARRWRRFPYAVVVTVEGPE